MSRLRRLARRARVLMLDWKGDILAIAAITCIAIGLWIISPPLSWLAVGVFLLIAAGDSRKDGA